VSDLKEWVSKNVFIILKGNFVYNGKVLSVDSNFMTILDNKHGSHVTFNILEIIKIEERE
jgi:small nuclear ribonucleoprotein (snRNP)-like protein